MYKYILKRSNRKTLSLKIDSDLNVVVSAPLFLSKAKIDDFVLKHTMWIDQKIEILKRRQQTLSVLTDENIKELKQMAALVLPKRVEYYSRIMGVTPTSVKITSAKKRFGSCSGKGGICFSYLLMLYPQEAIDYVVVHELAHIKHHNHSREFYDFVKEFLPDYKVREKILKKELLKMAKKLNNTYKKATQDKELTVVYFGGSVTAGTCASVPDETSWRGIIGEYLVKRFPDAEVKNVKAAIGGTGTGIGLFRMDEDVIAHKPDLVFIDFTLNDKYQKYTLEESVVYYESIIRRLYAANPLADIICLYISDRNVVYNGSEWLDEHKRLADHYSIPTISLNDVLAKELAETGNPIGDYLKDWVHPCDNGYKLYAEAIREFLEEDFNSVHEEPTATCPQEQYSSQPLMLGKTERVALNDMKDIKANGFLLEDGEFGAKQLYNCYHEGDEISFKFTGTYVGAMAHCWPNEEATSNLICIVDGVEVGSASFRKNDHSIIHVTFARDLPHGEHSVVLRNGEEGKGTIRTFYVYGE